MSEIFFIRHGQASFGSENYDRLSENGVLQAQILGEHLAALAMEFDGIYWGTMERQEKTAQEMTHAFLRKGRLVPETVIDDAFNEYDSHAIWDAQVKMMLRDDPTLLDELKQNSNQKKAFQNVFSKVMTRWISGEFDLPGIVPWKGFQHRVVQGVKRLVETCGSASRIAVFSSGGPISVVVQNALDLSDGKAMELSWQIMNASITRIKYNRHQISLASFNEVSHLELHRDKKLLTYR